MPYTVTGGEIRAPLTASGGDADRGRALVAGREAQCLLCHAIPAIGERLVGDVGPPLAGVAARLTEGELRLRVVDPTLVRGDIAMPSYYRVQGLNDVAQPYRGKPILTAQEAEDIVAYLRTLR